MYGWFYAVLGVPIYDANTVALLADTNSQGKKGTKSYAERAAGYLSYPQIQQLAANVTLAQAQQAAYLADQLNMYGNAAQTANPVAGQWANLPPAQYWIDLAAAEAAASANTSVLASSGPLGVSKSGNLVPQSSLATNEFTAWLGNTWAWMQANPLEAGVIVTVLGVGLYELFKPKKNKK